MHLKGSSVALRGGGPGHDAGAHTGPARTCGARAAAMARAGPSSHPRERIPTQTCGARKRETRGGPDAHDQAARHAKAQRAAHARRQRALKRKRGDAATAAPQMDSRRQEAVSVLFRDGWQASERHVARTLGVDPQWLRRMTCAAAGMVIDEEAGSLTALLRDVERLHAQGRATPQLFVLSRMYDETPVSAFTYILHEGGAPQGDASIAKVMASHVRFAMVCALEPGPDPPQKLPEALVIHGSLSSRLVAMKSQHAPIVLSSIRQTMALRPLLQRTVENTFPRLVVARNADLHRSNTAAEREQSRANPKWASALWRCSFHRVRTAEMRALALDASTEAFFFNFGLTLRRTPGAAKVLRVRVLEWARAKLVILHGSPPENVREWRAMVRQLLFPPVEARSQEPGVTGRGGPCSVGERRPFASVR